MNYIYSMNDRAYEIHEWAKSKGFWDHAHIKFPDDPTEPRYAPPRKVRNPSIIPEKLALISSEVSEALEAFRDEDWENFDEELADIIIRVLDLAQFMNCNIEQQVINKMTKNRDRPRLHGRKH